VKFLPNELFSRGNNHGTEHTIARWYLGGVQEEIHVQHPAPLVIQFHTVVLVVVRPYFFHNVPLLTMETVLNRLPEQAPTLFHHGIQAVVLHVHRVIRVRHRIRHVLVRHHYGRVEHLEGLQCVQRLGEQKNELKHTHDLFRSMSSLVQAQESVYREHQTVPLQDFRKVSDQGEGIRRIGLSHAGENSPVQKDTHKHQDGVPPPVHIHRPNQ
jgi:hypothetical protein